jgi:CBS domain containing-hemolysin-like protein
MTSNVPPARRGFRALVRASAVAPLALGAGAAHGSFLSGEALDTAADVMSWVVIVIVPIIGIAVFWIVHVMPEKIAHRRHHPQTQAIQVLCLLSLVFGGLLWPLAWLWAYTRPVAYRLAYGTDKHDEYFTELADKARRGEALEHELDTLRHELDSMHARGTLPANLAQLRAELDSLPPPRPADVPVAVATPARAD